MSSCQLRDPDGHYALCPALPVVFSHTTFYLSPPATFLPLLIVSFFCWVPISQLIFCFFPHNFWCLQSTIVPFHFIPSTLPICLKVRYFSSFPLCIWPCRLFQFYTHLPINGVNKSQTISTKTVSLLKLGFFISFSHVYLIKCQLRAYVFGSKVSAPTLGVNEILFVVVNALKNNI